MTIPVLTAVTDARWEAALVKAFEARRHGVAVVRRCVDLADLLATAAAGSARAALLSSDLRGLDRDALSRLAVSGVSVVGLVRDEESERRLRQLGVLHVLPADSAPETIAAAVVAATSGVVVADLPEEEPDEPGNGRIVAVWGPTGAPGRTTVAVTLACELAALGVATTLVDADVYGGAVAQALGLLDEAPGLAAAARLANDGLLDVSGLANVARGVGPHLRVLTGIGRAERWPELRPPAVEVVLSLCRRLDDVTVVDCGFSVERDEELSYDHAAHRRNGATLAVLGAADTVLAVGSAEPTSLQRLVRGLSDLAAAVPGARADVVVNRVRNGLMPGNAKDEIAAALQRYAGVAPVAYLPFDLAAADKAAMRGRSLTDVAKDSPLRLAVRGLAERVSALQPT